MSFQGESDGSGNKRMGKLMELDSEDDEGTVHHPHIAPYSPHIAPYSPHNAKVLVLAEPWCGCP